MKDLSSICIKINLNNIPEPSSLNDTFSMISSIATACGLIVATITGIIAYISYRNNLIELKKNNAYNLYQNYLNLCLNHPEYSKGYERTEHVKDSNYVKYSWFVSNMLFTFEQILNATKNDDKWLKAIKNQLKIHKIHLLHSRTVRNNEWETPLQNIINEIIAP